MEFRRIVTGYDDAGKSVILSDGQPATSHDFNHTPEMHVSLLWTTAPDQSVGKPVTDPTDSVTCWTPAPGGSVAMVVVFPPDSVMMAPDFDPMAAGGEFLGKLPGFACKFEAQNPGFHTTDTVDYGILLDGELIMELDDGTTTLVKKHDVIVQNGTRHAWRNRSDKPVPVLFVLVGANRIS